MTQAFSGVRIVDFTQVLAGPFAVMQLALLGADVIKIEQPGAGDQTRGLLNDGAGDGMSPAFMTCNVNKRSLSLDLKAPQARDIVARLVQSADVVVENFKAGTMNRLGFGYDTLKALKPDLIYCAVSGYGQSGPMAGVAAYDGAIQAASGMMSQTGHVETGPTRTGYMPVDMCTALHTAFAIAAALYRKRATGEGQFIDVAMLDTAIVAQAAQFSGYLNAGKLVGLNGNASPTGQPTADVFATADGYIQITALRQNQVEALFAVLGLSARLDEPAFADANARLANPDPVKACVREALKQQSTQHWRAALESAGVPVAEVRTVPEVAADPHLAHRGVLAELPAGPNGRPQRVVTAGYLTDRDGPRVDTPPPAVGAHTDEILGELGLTAAEVASLRKSSVV